MPIYLLRGHILYKSSEYLLRLLMTKHHFPFEVAHIAEKLGMHVEIAAEKVIFSYACVNLKPLNYSEFFEEQHIKSAIFR